MTTLTIPIRVAQSLQDETALRLAKMFQSSDDIIWGYTKRTPTGLEVGMKVREDRIHLCDLYEMIAMCNPLSK